MAVWLSAINVAKPRIADLMITNHREEIERGDLERLCFDSLG
jgi:hypothetical protein